MFICHVPVLVICHTSWHLAMHSIKYRKTFNHLNGTRVNMAALLHMLLHVYLVLIYRAASVQRPSLLNCDECPMNKDGEIILAEHKKMQ